MGLFLTIGNEAAAFFSWSTSINKWVTIIGHLMRTTRPRSGRLFIRQSGTTAANKAAAFLTWATGINKWVNIGRVETTTAKQAAIFLNWYNDLIGTTIFLNWYNHLFELED